MGTTGYPTPQPFTGNLGLDQTDFTFVEEWQSDAAIDAHLTTKHIRDALTKLPGLVSAEPDIRRYSVVKKEN
jgi:quinol monooxygenase YgiN